MSRGHLAAVPASAIDLLLAPGRALESWFRRASRGERGARQVLMDTLPGLLEAEERWLLQLTEPVIRTAPRRRRNPAASVDDAHSNGLMRHLHAHDAIRDLLDGMRASRPNSPEASVLLRVARGAVCAHLREERHALLRVSRSSGIVLTPRLQRYVRYARALPMMSGCADLENFTDAG